MQNLQKLSLSINKYSLLSRALLMNMEAQCKHVSMVRCLLPEDPLSEFIVNAHLPHIPL